jgi:hypothetical protein
MHTDAIEILLLSSQTPSRSHASPLRASGPSCACSIRSRSTATLHSSTKASVLCGTGCRCEPTLNEQWRGDVVLASAKCRPNACQEVIEMRSNEASELSIGSARTVDDKGHAQEGEWQEFGIKCDNEERHLTARVVLGEGIRVCERQRGQEDESVQEAACDGLSRY